MTTLYHPAYPSTAQLQPTLLLLGAVACASLPSIGASKFILGIHRHDPESSDPSDCNGFSHLAPAVLDGIGLAESFLGEYAWPAPLQTRAVVAIAAERADILTHASALLDAHRSLRTAIANSPRDDFGHRFAYEHLTSVMADGLHLRRHLSARLRQLLTPGLTTPWSHFLNRIDDHLADHVSFEL